MIVTISRIQHRMGLQADLPQLAPGEFGWAIDSRRLYIGNGLVEDGAPPAYTSPNNTEILTEWSIANLLANLPLYTYVGNSPITVMTGPDALHPVQRTIQQRLDDYVSVKAFGAIGDGVADDTDAINRALYELYVHDNTIFNHKILLFPAGNYSVTDLIKIPTNARLVGEGMDCTFINQLNLAKDSVISTADSMQHIDLAMGLYGASYPGNNYFANMTFTHVSKIKNVVKLDRADTITFDNVKFLNHWNTGDGNVSGAQAIVILSELNHLTSNVKFNNCEFYGHEYVNRLDYDAVNINFNNCKFMMGFRAFSIGENLTYSGAQSSGPYGYRITNSYFDKISERAIKTFYTVESLVSGFNSFYDVGNNNTGITGYNYPIIEFSDSGNQSIGDFSLRPDNQDTVPAFNIAGSQNLVISVNNGILLNRYESLLSDEITLLDNQSAVLTGISKDSNYWTNIDINYTIARSTQIRYGKLRVVVISGNAIISDDFDEPNGSVGVVFSVTLIGTVYSIRYSTTNTGSDAIMAYQINSMR